MTNKAVTNVSGLMAGFSTNSVGRTGSNLAAADSFSSVMQKTTGQNQAAEQTELKQTEGKQPEVQENSGVIKENTKAAQKIEDSQKPAEERTNEEAQNGAKKAVGETADKVVEKVADTLGLSKEEVEEAMETLGLTAVSLLDRTNLAELLLNLSGETDQMALLTNETLSTGMQDILRMVQTELSSIQEMYGMNAEQLNFCVETLNEEEMQQLAAALQEQEGSAAEGSVADTIPVLNAENEGTDEAAVQPEKAVITLNKGGEQVQAVVETDGETGVSTITQQSAPLTGQEENSMAGEETEDKEGRNNSETSKNGSLLLQNVTQNQNTAAAATGTEPVLTENGQVQDIMDQILDYMKLQVKPDTTNLELQLHPESLGTLNVQIAQKNGMLTAQFTAQNETVKNVIETQLITLQQQFEEQGIKVEAVEVNVAAGQLDRNLNEGQGNNGKASEEAKKKQTRRINLNDLNALEEEELEEADRVTADMMARNGNTVDYLA